MIHGRYHLYYDRDGQPVGLTEWAALLEDPTYRSVALNYVRGWGISTIWLGIDRGWFSPVPLIFETMIFPPGDVRLTSVTGDLDDYQARYPTADATVAGHAAALTAVLGHLGLDAAADVTTGRLTDPGDVDWVTLPAWLRDGQAQPDGGSSGPPPG